MNKYLVMKAHSHGQCATKTPSAFVVRIDDDLVRFLHTFTESARPYLASMQKIGFCKAAVSTVLGEWMSVQDERKELEKEFWADSRIEFTVIDCLPSFFEVMEVETQSVSCDDPTTVNFKASLIGKSTELFTDDVPIQLIADAAMFRVPPKATSQYAIDPTHCPVCGGQEIWSDEGDFIVTKDGKEVSSPVYCKSCHSRWEDVYHITGYRKLKEGEAR